MISEEYRRMNQVLHENPAYGNSATRWVPYISYMRGNTVLDYGCGKGKIARKANFPIDEYDPAIPGKDTLPEPHQCVICTDVMEHIEPEYLDAVLEHIQSLMLEAGFFVISTKAAKKVLPDGRNAHLIIKPAVWWMDKLSDYFFVRTLHKNVTQDCEAVFLVEARDD